jgi:hypothetical protein
MMMQGCKLTHQMNGVRAETIETNSLAGAVSYAEKLCGGAGWAANPTDTVRAYEIYD